MNHSIVAKFGGTSLADALQFSKVIGIVRSEPKRRFVVVSAPGKQHEGNQKVTDLLYGLRRGINGMSSEQILSAIESRFQNIVSGLGLDLNLAPNFFTLRHAAQSGELDFLVSLGEYICARILAAALHYDLVDAATIIRFDSSGKLDMESTLRNKNYLLERPKGCVIPGFYGSLPDGSVRTFTRGGSDLTGAIIAAMVRADLYENWTDVSGLRMADPEVVPEACRINLVTHKELRELTYRGAHILHDEVIFPLRELGIPIQLLNTNNPGDQGTRIVPDSQAPSKTPGSIVGIAGRKDFTIITIEKALMNREVGFLRLVCGVFEEERVSIEHLPGGIDTVSVVVRSENVAEKQDRIVARLTGTCEPDKIFIDHKIALICTVGNAMAYTPGVAARLFQAVAGAGVNVRMIDQGSSELSIIIGVENHAYETAVRAIYNAFTA